jgi:hypothetical protein
VRPIVQSKSITEHVETGTATDIYQLDGLPNRCPRERRPEQGGAADLIGLDGASVEHIQKYISVPQAQVPEERRGRLRRVPRIDVGKGVLDAIQEKVVGTGQQHGRKMCMGTRRVLKS